MDKRKKIFIGMIMKDIWKITESILKIVVIGFGLITLAHLLVLLNQHHAAVVISIQSILSWIAGLVVGVIIIGVIYIWFDSRWNDARVKIIRDKDKKKQLGVTK